MKSYIYILILSLLLLVGCESTTTTNTTDTVVPLNKLSVAEVAAKEWYVRIVVEDTTNNMKTASAQLGQLEATDAATKHSLKALAPFTSTFLDVVFKNPIGIATGEYKSNFHTTNASDSWEFSVKSYDANATMILTWRGLYVLTPYIDSENRMRYREYISRANPLIPYMKLIDITSGIEVPADNNGTAQVYTFKMIDGTDIIGTDSNGNPTVIGKSKAFRWVLQNTPVQSLAVPKRAKFLKALEVKALRKDAKAKPDALKKKRLNSLNMTQPPRFEVLVK